MIMPEPKSPQISVNEAHMMVEPSYSRELGWCEYDEDGDYVPAAIIVVAAFVGYDVFRVGQEICHLKWSEDKEDSVDWAVDRCRAEMSDHELRQAQRE